MTTHAHLRRLGLFDKRVPRFTSFPPANWFSEDVSGEVVQGWRSATPAGAALSLYVHVPFCKRLCWFCACRTQGTRSHSPLFPYVDRLLSEAIATRSQLNPDVYAERLHLGGGTPTIMSADLLETLLTGLKREFDLESCAEFSAEIDPTDVGPKRLDTLVKHGLNRASLGIQDFDPKVQEAIGREQSFERTREVVEALKARNVTKINFDLLYGLPFQTRTSLANTLAAALSLSPSRIALFGYAHVPWMSKRQAMIEADALPGPEERLAQFELAQQILESRGYIQIGIDHFARADDSLVDALNERRLKRSFQGYTDDVVPRLVGLGASSISTYPQGFAQNISITGKYAQAIEAGQSAVWRGYALRPEDQIRAQLIEDLMCYFEADLSKINASWEFIAQIEQVVEEFSPAIAIDDGFLRAERWAHSLIRIIAARIAMLDNQHQADRRYSAAI